MPEPVPVHLIDLTPTVRLRMESRGPAGLLLTRQERSSATGEWAETPDAWAKTDIVPEKQAVMLTGTREGAHLMVEAIHRLSVLDPGIVHLARLVLQAASDPEFRRTGEIPLAALPPDFHA